MEVILREHVDNLGRRGEVVKVADGTRAITCCPASWRCSSTAGNRKQIERERAKFEAKEAEERRPPKQSPSGMVELEIVIARQVGETKRCTDRSRPRTSPRRWPAKGFEIDRRKLQLRRANQDPRRATTCR